jgi:uncharacterized small protein (DUF1192 family)
MNSAAINADKPAAGPINGKASSEILQDILYELLANGMDPYETRVSAEQIETFLFEHARSPKPTEAFVEFFKQHGLSIQPEDHIKPLELKALNAGAGRISSLPPPLPPREMRPAPDRDLLGKPEALSSPARESAPGAFGQPGLAPGARKSFKSRLASPMVWAAAASLAMALGAVAALVFSVASLKAELTRTKAAQYQSQHAVAELQRRLGAMQSDVALTGRSVRDLEPRIDLLVQTLVAPTEAAPAELER